MKKIYQRCIPPLLTIIMALWFFAQLQTPKDKDFAFTQFAQLPVVADGRLKPMDSLARNSLLQIYERQTFNTEPWKDGSQKPQIIPATEWLANVMMNPQVADTWPVFRVDNPDLIAFLKLPEKNLTDHQDGQHYSWDQVGPQLDAFDTEFARVDKTEPSERSAYERAVVKVHDRMELYAQLKNAVQPENASDWKSELIRYLDLIPAGVTAVQAQQAGKKYDEKMFNDFANELQRFNFMAQAGPPLVIPPEKTGDNWQRTGTVLMDAARGDDIPKAVAEYAAMTEGLQATNAAVFNTALADYRQSLVPNFQPVLGRMRAEVFFNQMQPFYNAMIIYVLAGLLAVFSWFNLSETLRRSAVWLVGLAFFIHTTGLVYRIVLSGRPPVTNLYSSAIFIGWGAVILGLILEKFHKNGIGACASAGMGFITLIIAQNLSLDGDTMEMMRAVLDTNFWLATHVVAVTTGYASTFVAGFLAWIYIVRGVFTKTLDEETSKSLARMVYAIVCFATLFSFVGTVLGGIWADQSWGRFWGWDPKENGALIIVLWNALILHLRWGGMIRERGLMCCAVFGNVVTSWSWFGVNMLGIGLHSYGFTDAAFKWLSLFVLSQLCFIALGLMPRKMWKSSHVPA